MSKTLYENDYKKTSHFSFGENWRDFIKSLTPKRIIIAKESLENFLRGKLPLEGKTFIDVGCGSGIFSLAALKLGAKKVLSIDVDQKSIECVQFLKDREGNQQNWQIKQGSVLNKTFIKTLGEFDVVYSWGVLHHTGDMYQAIKNASTLVKKNGQFYIAIYNDYRGLIHGKSRSWLKIKKKYNTSNNLMKKIYFWHYFVYLFVGLCLTLKNPFRYIKNYQSARGMSFKHDILDWLGGYPYEFATPVKIITYLSGLGFTLKNIKTVNTIGCNEYLFVKNKPVNKLSRVTVLMSVYNGAKTLEKTLKSIFSQTLKPNLVCVNDASIDETAQVLNHWYKKIGERLNIITNSHNLGLTKSLNFGLKKINTIYTARIDADDWWEKDKLEKQVNFLEANPKIGLVGSWYINYGLQGNKFVTPPVTDKQIRKTVIYQNPFAHSSVVFRTNLVKKIGGYDEKVRFGQDYELWLRTLPKTRFFNLPLYLCHRSFRSGISIERQNDQARSALKTRLKYINQYQLPWRAYLSLVEPLILSLTPRFLANLKRKIS